MRVGTKGGAAIIYLFTQPLTELASTACCISEDVSLSLSLSQSEPISRWYHYMTAECVGINLYFPSHIFIYLSTFLVSLLNTSVRVRFCTLLRKGTEFYILGKYKTILVHPTLGFLAEISMRTLIPL